MTSQITRSVVALAVFLILWSARPARAGYLLDWEASSGLLPSQISPPWSLYQSSNSLNPVLSGGILTLTTSSNSDELGYQQLGPIVNTSAPFSVVFNVKYVSGQTTNSARSPIDIQCVTAPGVGNGLWIDQNQVFFNTGTLVAGPKVNVDTTNSFHTYEIDYNGAGNINLLYDGSSILTATTYSSSSDFGSQEQIAWGDGTLGASGTSEWTFFRDNAVTVPEPFAPQILLVTIGAFEWLGRRRHSR